MKMLNIVIVSSLEVDVSLMQVFFFLW